MKGIKEIWVLKKVHVEGQISHYKKKEGAKKEDNPFNIYM